MTEVKTHVSHRRLRTPRAAAIAGIIFAVLMTTSYSLIYLSVPAVPLDRGEWLARQARNVSLALSLVPFAGIAFLWFIGVVRDRLGYLEDQFFATLFFGSGLLYLAMMFAAAAIAGGLLTVYALEPEPIVDSGSYLIARAITFRINTVYATRMAGMTMLVLGTIWIRTGTMPRWLALITYALALILLISIGFTQWVILIFPAWVFLISVYILILNYRHTQDEESRDGLSVAG
jgi:hypothetical protein